VGLADRLLYTLLHYSTIGDTESVVGFSDESTFVSYQNKWIDLSTLSISSAEPLGLKVLFNAHWNHRTSASRNQETRELMLLSQCFRSNKETVPDIRVLYIIRAFCLVLVVLAPFAYRCWSPGLGERQPS